MSKQPEQQAPQSDNGATAVLQQVESEISAILREGGEQAAVLVLPAPCDQSGPPTGTTAIPIGVIDPTTVGEISYHSSSTQTTGSAKINSTLVVMITANSQNTPYTLGYNLTVGNGSSTMTSQGAGNLQMGIFVPTELGYLTVTAFQGSVVVGTVTVNITS
jgi:hypothetical protein